MIPSGFLDDVKEHGLRLKVRENKWDTIYHFYPVYIKKKVYRLDLIEIESMPGGDRDKYRKWGETIGYDKVDKKEYGAAIRTILFLHGTTGRRSDYGDHRITTTFIQ